MSKMDEKTIIDALAENETLGFVTRYGDDSYQLSPCGKAFVEVVLLAQLEDRAEVFAAGWHAALRQKGKKP